jgi:hypothetical protein
MEMAFEENTSSLTFMGVEFLGIPSQLRKKFNIEKQTLALLR